MKMKKTLLALSIGALLFSGCTHRLGNMTVVSTNNIDGLKAEVKSEQRIIGESCNYTAIIFPFGDFENRLQIATDKALDNGHNAGLKGDVLVNAKIDVNAWYIPFIYGQNCLRVQGDMIPLSNSIK
jgi:hypothetical protein